MTPPADIRLSFNEVPEIYDAIRPTYPAELFDALFERLSPDPHIIEVGPATGQATGDLLARGATVHAIEIGPALAEALRAKLLTEQLRITVGDFERVELPAGEADGVFSATAYHWISPPAQLDRPAQILRPGGVLAIIEGCQVNSDVDRGFFAAAQPIYNRWGSPHVGPPAPTRDAVDSELRRRLEADARFESVEFRQWDWDQTYSAADYRTLMLSYSGTQMMAEDERNGLLDDIEAFVEDRFDGTVTRPLVVTLTTATLRAVSPR